MAAIFTGIGKAIGSLFKVEPKAEDESLEEKINKVLAEEREKIRPSREDIDIFGWITEDNNPIHRIPKRAKLMGLDDVPLMGAHIAAYGEQFIESVVQNMREYWGADIKILGQENKFRAPLYPGERTLWQVTGYRQIDGGIEIDVKGSVKEKGVITITSRLGKVYPQMPQIAGPIFSDRYLLDKDHIEEFFNCVGGKSNGKVPNMLPAAYVPATLLTLLKLKTKTREGINMAMRYDFLREAEAGELQVDIFPPREPSERRGQFVYKFKTVVSQRTAPLTYGELISSTPKKIEFYI